MRATVLGAWLACPGQRAYVVLDNVPNEQTVAPDMENSDEAQVASERAGPAAAAPGHPGATDELEQARAEQRREANQYLGVGLGIGAFGAASALVLGAVCPVCVVAAPALIAAGAYKRYRARR